MFGSLSERKRQQDAEFDFQLQQDKQRLLAMSEKELMIEILFELKRIDRHLDRVQRTVVAYGG